LPQHWNKMLHFQVEDGGHLVAFFVASGHPNRAFAFVT
jgi:hypothetical protein